MARYIRIACAVPPVSVADIRNNVRNICRLIQQADSQDCRVVVFPELAVTGYTCGDLFFQQLLRDQAKNALQQITTFTAQYSDLTCVVGVPLELEGQLYNCAAVVQAGRLLGIVPKMNLTDHRESPEARWFAQGDCLLVRRVRAAEFGMEDYDVPTGGAQVFDVNGIKLGVEICEDLFVTCSPAVAMARHGAQIIVNPAASMQLVGTRKKRRELVRHQSAACGCVYGFCSAGFGESTRDCVYSGHSIIANRGELIAENNEPVAQDYLLCTDVWLDAQAYDTKYTRRPLQPVRKQPFDTDEEACREMFAIQSAGLACRLQKLGANAVVGVSGGLDSTLALLVAVQAMQRLGRPATDVHALTMPCFGTSDRTYENALTLMKLLGVTVKQIDIRPAVLQHFNDIGHDPQVHDTTYENAQARERTQILMDYAGATNAIVVGTGDMSELALGWCTYNGDHMSMYSVNASIPKTVIPPIIRTVSRMPLYCNARDVLEDIIATPISPELLPGDQSGSIAQKTEDIVGPYVLHDFFLFYGIKEGYSPSTVLQMATRVFEDKFDRQTVKKWMKVFYRRFFAQQFKRSCMPEGVKVTEFSFSPRGDWLMPGDASAALWLEAIEQL